MDRILACLLVVLVGCSSPSGPPPGPAADDVAQALPDGLAMDGGEVVTYTADEVRWRWRGVAPLHPTGILSAVATDPVDAPYVETFFDVPAGLELLVGARVQGEQTPRFDPKLALAVLNEEGETMCRSAIVASSYQACGAGIDTRDEPGRFALRIESAFVARPASTFVAHVALILPAPPAPLPAAPPQPALEPHVIVGITDTGVNPYHEVYYRPERTQHPCTYVEGYPCDIPALSLSLGIYEDYEVALAGDDEVWSSVEPGQWYWIPRSALIAVHCASDGPACIRDTKGHGTLTSSTVLLENPDALLVVNQGVAEDNGAIMASGLPVDLYSFSWGYPYPQVADASGVYVHDCQRLQRDWVDRGLLFIAAAGNWPELGSPSTLADCGSGDPRIITVGGATAQDRSHSGTWHPDVVSWVCREGASPTHTTAWSRACGTSMAAPSVAGALSRVILELRRASGYVGGGDVIDPLLGITMHDVRDAMNLTATYTPQARYDETNPGLVLNPIAPWHQWGWGFYDSTLVNETVANLLGTGTATKPAAAVQWMEAQHGVKKELWGA